MAGIDTFASSKARARIERILLELAKLPMTGDELQCLLGVSQPTMWRYLNHLRSEPRRVYVSKWTPTVGELAPVYAVGILPDARRPKPITKRKRNQMQWKRLKADRDRHERMKATARVNGAIQRVRGKPQPWFAALMVTR